MIQHRLYGPVQVGGRPAESAFDLTDDGGDGRTVEHGEDTLEEKDARDHVG